MRGGHEKGKGEIRIYQATGDRKRSEETGRDKEIGRGQKKQRYRKR